MLLRFFLSAMRFLGIRMSILRRKNKRNHFPTWPGAYTNATKHSSTSKLFSNPPVTFPAAKSAKSSLIPISLAQR